MILQPTTGRWHTSSHEDLAGTLTTNLDAGLTDEEAGRRLQSFGWNELPPAAPVSSLTVLLRQFSSPVI